ncbi:MAG: hypothetical protein B7733_22525 [Myxococcales bacterium FL481]|nr:MAG: hypothetical protein B7733_22525 [Myxococcales bacterium FL481]
MADRIRFAPSQWLHIRACHRRCGSSGQGLDHRYGRLHGRRYRHHPSHQLRLRRLIMNKTRTLLYGLLFGFILSRSDATSFDAIYEMFMFTDFHLYGVIGSAIAVAAGGFWWLRRESVPASDGAPLALARKTMRPGLVGGSLLFGVGWAISGTCPGTALAQLGQGSLAAIFTITGILLGAWTQGRVSATRST